MSTSVLAAGFAAVVLFWAIGAYNRLVRLRAQALQAFGALLVQLRCEQALAESAVAARPGDVPATVELVQPEEVGASDGLAAAARQLGVSLAAAQARPLQPSVLRSLGAAEGVLRKAWEWEQARSGTAEPISADAPLPEWQTISVRQAHAAEEFDRVAACYNQALQQFPARIIASLCGLRQAGTWAR